MEERRRRKAVEEKEKAIDDDEEVMVEMRWKERVLMERGRVGTRGVSA